MFFFGAANAGVKVDGVGTLTMATFVALIVGKTLGIVFFALLAHVLGFLLPVGQETTLSQLFFIIFIIFIIRYDMILYCMVLCSILSSKSEIERLDSGGPLCDVGPGRSHLENICLKWLPGWPDSCSLRVQRGNKTHVFLTFEANIHT